MISATIENWNDVIEFKIFGRAAIGADRPSPLSSLSGAELLAVPAKLGRFVVDMSLSPWKYFKHFVTVKTPQFAGCFRNSLAGLFCMTIPGGVFISETLSFSAFGNLALRFIRMGMTPKRVVLSTVIESNAGIRTESRLPIADSPCLTEKLFTACYTFKKLSWFVLHLFLHRMPPSDNGVNSKNNSILRLSEKKVKGNMESTLSQARRETSLKVQRLGDEAKGYAHAGNFPQECPTRKG